jgi:aryl-alcohol dehydrogenase-like predicted oxidoreductase
MDVRVLGPSGLRVSMLCLGTATFGNPEWGCDEAEGARILDAFIDAGGNFLDTANKYADGRSEEVLGGLLRGRRGRVVVGTKFTASMDDGDPNASGNQRKNLVSSLESSLRRLATDYVDIFWVHAWDGITAVEELMRGLDDQVRAGKVLSVGISNAPAWMIAHANAMATLRGWTPFIAVQNEYNLLERGAERELLPMTRFFGLGYLAWAPLAQGRLAGKYVRSSGEPRRLSADEARLAESKRQIVSETVEVAQEIGCQPTAVALRWIMQQQPDTIPILGARTLDQLVSNLKCLEIELSADEMDRLESVSAIDAGSPTGFMRGEPGRTFMWGNARTVPPGPARATKPWWEP